MVVSSEFPMSDKLAPTRFLLRCVFTFFVAQVILSYKIVNQDEGGGKGCQLSFPPNIGGGTRANARRSCKVRMR